MEGRRRGLTHSRWAGAESKLPFVLLLRRCVSVIAPCVAHCRMVTVNVVSAILHQRSLSLQKLD